MPCSLAATSDAGVRASCSKATSESLCWSYRNCQLARLCYMFQNKIRMSLTQCGM